MDNNSVRTQLNEMVNIGRLANMDVKLVQGYAKVLEEEITLKQLSKDITQDLKDYSKREIAIMLIFKSVGWKTAEYKVNNGFNPTHVVGLFYNRTWEFKGDNKDWFFKLSKDPFRTVHLMDNTDKELMYINGSLDKGEEMSEDLATDIIQECFKDVLKVIG